MKVELLNSSHKEAVRDLFYINRHMGVKLDQAGMDSFVNNDLDFQETYHGIFCDTYLSNLNNYKVFGTVDDDSDKVTSYVSFYESVETPDWFCTQVRSKNQSHIKHALDRAIQHNEDNGRYKFFSMFNSEWEFINRRFAFSERNRERYEFVNEFIVPAKTKCMYLVPWQILFNRTLMPVDCLVSCAFLKQKYRPELTIAGFL